MIRAGIHGQYSEQDTFFDTSFLHPGQNTISLTQSSGGSAQKSIMYDAIRLELDPAHPYTKSLAAAHPRTFPQTAAEANDE